jgi:hypothetical protein
MAASYWAVITSQTKNVRPSVRPHVTLYQCPSRLPFFMTFAVEVFRKTSLEQIEFHENCVGMAARVVADCTAFTSAPQNSTIFLK